jgi:hypothetical protein
MYKKICYDYNLHTNFKKKIQNVSLLKKTKSNNHNKNIYINGQN